MIQEFRRARRRKAADMIQVSDAMTGEMVGRIGNLSESGLLLIASSSLENDALYQLRFTLPGRSAGAGHRHRGQEHHIAPRHSLQLRDRALAGAGFPQQLAVAAGHLVGADHHRLRLLPGNRPGLGRGKAQGQRGRWFGRMRRLVDIGPGGLERQAQPVQQLGAIA